MIEKGAGAILGLSGFALAVVLGVTVNNPIETILWRATMAMLCCFAAGWFIGMIAARIMREHVEKYKYYNPIRPEDMPVEPEVAENEDEENQEKSEENETETAQTGQAVDATQPAV